jgi:hypothetical protein
MGWIRDPEKTYPGSGSATLQVHTHMRAVAHVGSKWLPYFSLTDRTRIRIAEKIECQHGIVSKKSTCF